MKLMSMPAAQLEYKKVEYSHTINAHNLSFVHLLSSSMFNHSKSLLEKKVQINPIIRHWEAF